MSTINIKGVVFQRGDGYRIIDEGELRARVTKFASNSKWIEMIRKYGGKKLKVYGYDANTDRVWMSADHSDTYTWKSFMLKDVYNHNVVADDRANSDFSTIEAAVSRARPATEPKPSRSNKLLKMMLLMSIFASANSSNKGESDGKVDKEDKTS